MRQHNIGRSALLTGGLVLALLVGGRMLGSWHAERAGAAGRSAISSGQSAAPAPTVSDPPTGPAPAPSDGPSASPTPGGGKGNTQTAPPSATPSKPKKVKDPTFGALRRTGSAAVALTFDDGPQPTYTPQLLDQLHSQGVKATFCLVGTEVRKFPELVARIVREGHTLCNHSWHHDLKLGKKTPEQIRADLSRTNAEIRKAVPNARIPYYRQPGGAWTAEIVTIAGQLGMKPLGWEVDPADWEKPGASTITKRVMKYTHAGSIVLMHDGGGDRSGTIEACRSIIPRLKQRYKLIALP